jgi:hypothetical protein
VGGTRAKKTVSEGGGGAASADSGGASSSAGAGEAEAEVGCASTLGLGVVGLCAVLCVWCRVVQGWGGQAGRVPGRGSSGGVVWWATQRSDWGW